MPRKYAVAYIDALLAEGDLAEISSAIKSDARFSSSATDYGLPLFAFLLDEILTWTADSLRSGVWQYYKITPLVRQEFTAAALRDLAPREFATWYQHGMRNWRDQREIAKVDDWIEANDEALRGWLRSLTRANRDAILEWTK
jgi:hypothetical protein